MKKKKCIISLIPFGMPYEGSVCDKTWLSSIRFPYTQSSTVSELYVDLPNKKIQFISTESSGTFGYIDLAHRTDDSSGEMTKYVFVKRPRLKGTSLLQEACVQKLVHDSLRRAGFDTGAPNVLDIIRFRNNSIGFSMECIQRSQTLHTMLNEITTDTSATKLVIDCIYQLSAMLWHLETDVSLNHRDLKPSNILIIERNTPIKRRLIIEDIEIQIETSIDISFIDFGFSCIGNIQSAEPNLSMGGVYDKKDPCPKAGRDMYLFLAFLYAEFNARFSEDFIQLLETWLSKPSSKIIGFLKKYGRDADNWIYMITGNKDVHELPCTPSSIIRDLQQYICSK